MPTKIVKRGVRRSSGQSAFRVVLLCTIFAGGIAAASMIGRHFVDLHDAPPPAYSIAASFSLLPTIREGASGGSSTGSIPSSTVGAKEETQDELLRRVADQVVCRVTSMVTLVQPLPLLRCSASYTATGSDRMMSPTRAPRHWGRR